MKNRVGKFGIGCLDKKNFTLNQKGMFGKTNTCQDKKGFVFILTQVMAVSFFFPLAGI